MPDHDITKSLKSFTGLHGSDVSDAYFLSTRVSGGKETEKASDTKGQKLERCGLLSVRNVRDHNQTQPGASLISDAVFWNIVATWPTAREHPRWRNRPELRREVARLERRRRAWQPPRFRFPSDRR